MTTLTSCSEIAIRETNRFSAMNSANKREHLQAWTRDSNPVAGMVFNWIMYADQHKERFDSMIGDDYVLGKDWFAMGLAIRGLLNGELRGLDGGTIDGIILGCLKANGFEEGKDW